MYYVVWALLFFRQPQYTADRKTSLTYATLWLLVVIPMIAFEVKPYTDFWLDNTFLKVLLAFKLDHDIVLSYMNIFTPLHVCLFTLMFSSCSGRGGNKWWFGMRTDFCSALLKCLPCLTIYGNIYIGEKVRISIELRSLTYFYSIPKAHQEILLPINSLWEITVKILCSKAMKDLIP